MNNSYAATVETQPAQQPSLTAPAPEFSLLLACARTVPDAPRIQALISAGVDWRTFTDLATTHGVRPLVHRSLQAICWDQLPANIQSEWHETARSLAIKTLFITGELLRITAELHSANVPAAVLKGPVIAELAYGDLSLREFSDLDLLVEPGHVAAAVNACERLGYHPDWNLDIGTITRFLCYFGERKLSNTTLAADIDLHWRLSTRSAALAPELSDFPSGFKPVTLAGSTVLSLALEDLPLYLAAQGAWDQWCDFRRICDLAEFLRRYPDLDWQPSLAAARRLGGLRSMLTGLALAVQLLDAPPPAPGTHLFLADPIVARLAETTILRLQQGFDPASPVGRYLFQLQAKQGRKRKLALLWRILTDRTSEDGEWLMLPRPLWWLYAVLRPIRMSSKFLRRA